MDQLLMFPTSILVIVLANEVGGIRKSSAIKLQEITCASEE
jgi:hypothetical protein